MGFFGGILANGASDLISLATQNIRGSIASKIGGYVNAANQLGSGNILGAVGVLREMNGHKEYDIFGGGTLGDVLETHKEMIGIEWEYKNRFFVEILDLNPLESATVMLPASVRSEAIQAAKEVKGFLGDLNATTLGISGALLSNAMGMLTGAAKFNLYAVNVQYTPFTIEGEQVNIGSGSIDNLTGTGRVELTLTCRDDKFGTIKRWMDGKAAQTANMDGTFGVPAEYAVNIRILNGYINDEISMGRGLEHSFVCRVAGYDVDKSRSDTGLNELSLKFVQIDTMRTL